MNFNVISIACQENTTLVKLNRLNFEIEVLQDLEKEFHKSEGEYFHAYSIILELEW